ncbi:MAG: xanthine dehydrogenase accessory protein XdhC [Pseudomonadota bacterium]
MADWAAQARSALARGPTALVTILATEGSAPRGPGTRMIVTRHGQSGTIGGGALEYRAVEQGRALLDQPVGAWRIQDYPLGPLLGQCCGGRVRLLVEHLDATRADWMDAPGRHVARLTDDGLTRTRSDARPPPLSARGDKPASGSVFREPDDAERLSVQLFGAGHVGQAIARIAEDLPLHLGWFDARADYAGLPGVTAAPEDELVACAAAAQAGSAVLIVTHDHALDYRLTAAALHSEAGFVGLIGSATKRARFLSRLTDDGFDDVTRARLTCPIGVPGIGGKEPAVIAVATIAQLLTLQRL